MRFLLRLLVLFFLGLGIGVLAARWGVVPAVVVGVVAFVLLTVFSLARISTICSREEEKGRK